MFRKLSPLVSKKPRTFQQDQETATMADMFYGQDRLEPVERANLYRRRTAIDNKVIELI